MLFRSVVGKLWITIIILVSAIFLFLSISLIEYFDRYYYTNQSNDLTALGERVSKIMEEYPDRRALVTASEVVDSAGASMVTINFDDNGKIINNETSFTDKELSEVLKNSPNIVRLNDQTYKDFITFNSSNDNLVLAIPVYEGDKSNSAIILYHSLENLYETTSDIKKMILLFATIGILITTVFAFFLSTRITAPVREMQKAAIQMAKGDFHTKVNIKTSDEIGDLARSFNRMASQLDETVQALSNEKEKLSNILKSMADSVVTFNTQGNIIITNPPADKLLYSWREKRYVLPKSLTNMLKDVLNEKKNIAQDIHLSGHIFDVKMTPLYSGREVMGAVALLRDVTYERKLNKLRKDFLANVSHELRTPISMLQGYSEAIIDDIAETQEEKKELVKIIYDESLRMGRLVNELLDLAKMESGTYTLLYCKVDIEKLIYKMSKKFSALVNENEINFITEIDKDVHEAYIDIDRIEQVLTNLIDNAIRHTPKGGQIILRAKKYSDNNIMLEVEDSGEGIPEEDLPFVFERFYKADKARTRNQSGTGLGLSIAKNIVQSHGGSISVASKVSQGTTFSIVLPTNNMPKE